MRRATILTAKIARSAWSFGYEWYTPTSPTSLKADAARDAALPKVQADVIALRQDATHAQFGLGHLDSNDRSKGMVAAIAFAAEQAKQTIRTAIGLFEVPGGFWCGVVQNDLIPPDGDQIYETHDDALAAIGLKLLSREWSRIYLPSQVLADSAERVRAAHAAGDEIDAFDALLEQHRSIIAATPLADLLRAAKAPPHQQRTLRRTDMRAVALSRPVLAGAAVIATGLVIVFGALPLYRQLTAAPPPKLAALPPPPPPPPPTVIDTPSPSINQPTAAAWLSICFDQMAALDDATPAGWDDITLDCQASRASLQLTRSWGALEILDAAYPGALLSYDTNYDHATVSHALNMPAPPRAEHLAPAEELRRRLIQLGWSTREKIRVEPFAIPPGRQAADRATWRQAGFTITSPTDIAQWASVLDRIPGVTISSVTADAHQMKIEPAKFRWEIKGLLYAQ